MPKVYNKHHGNAPDTAVFVARPSKFGNPFVVGKDGNRGECVILFEDYAYADQEFMDMVVDELAGKDLVCYCYPRDCHANSLMRIANGEPRKVRDRPKMYYKSSDMNSLFE